MRKHIRSIELLEARIAPATFTVTSNAESGTGSFIEALLNAESSMGLDTIAFNLAPGSLTITISLAVAVTVSSQVIIDGRTQPGYAGSPLVSLVAPVTPTVHGLFFGNNSAGSQVHGLAISGFDEVGVLVTSDNVLIAGCTVTGNQTGISVTGDNVTIGGIGAAGRNVISGNTGRGIFADSVSGLVVQNSHIGVDRTGLIAQGNGNIGIFVQNSVSPTIGGAEKNVIADNGAGIFLNEVSGDVRVQNNYIGLYADGTFNGASGNSSSGIFAVGPANFVIGTDGILGAPNYVANNGGPGIYVSTNGQAGKGTAVITGNVVGSAPVAMALVPATNSGAILAFGPGIRIGGAGAEANNIAWQNLDGIRSSSGEAEIRGNFFTDSGDDVIDVFSDGPTPNDADEADGAQNFPVLAGAVVDAMGNYAVFGSLDSTPNTQFRVNIYGYNQPRYDSIGDFLITTDAAGHAAINHSVPTLAGFANVAMTATNTTTGHTSEMSALANIGPEVFFSEPEGVSQAEGNAGVAFVNFTVHMSAAPAGAVSVVLSATPGSTATLGTDYTFTPQVLNFSPGITQQNVTVAITGDTGVEPLEFINFVLGGIMGNALYFGSTKIVSILNDDTSLRITPDGKTATWRDVDGDFVTLKSTKGILDAGDFTLEAQGSFGGETLLALDLSDDGAPAKGAGLALTAKFDRANNRGDGALHVGYINATGVDLGIVKLDGDLGRIAAGDTVLTDGAIKSLTVGSIGVLGTSTQAVGGSLMSEFQGKVGALTVRGDVVGARLDASGGMVGNPAAGSFGPIAIAGNFESAGAKFFTRIIASGDIASLKIGGSMIAHTGINAGVFADGRIGAVTIGGSINGNGGRVALSAGLTMGKVLVGGDVAQTNIAASGKARPANAAAALAIVGLSVRGHVADSFVIAGLGAADAMNPDGTTNPDAQIGAIIVGGDWSRSSVAAGTNVLTDFTIGDSDDALAVPTGPYTDNPAIISKIASITIKGHIYGTAAAGDSFGFVAQSIGKFVRGTTAYTLRPNPAQPLDLVSLSIHGDVFLREVI